MKCSAFRSLAKLSGTIFVNFRVHTVALLRSIAPSSRQSPHHLSLLSLLSSAAVQSQHANIPGRGWAVDVGNINYICMWFGGEWGVSGSRYAAIASQKRGLIALLSLLFRMLIVCQRRLASTPRLIVFWFGLERCFCEPQLHYCTESHRLVMHIISLVITLPVYLALGST